MKFSFSLAACGVALVLMMTGCANIERAFGPVSQTSTPAQTSNYHAAYAHDSGPGAAASPAPAPQAYPGTFPPVTPRAPMPMPMPPVAPPVAALPPARAAILLPLSGPNAALGQAMFNAAQQAVFDAAGTNFRLLPHDTEAAGGAGAAARAAAGEGAQIIIGPLFAANVPAVRAVAQQAGIAMLTLSTDASLAQAGVYVMGIAPGPQVARVVAFAAAHGAKRFAALVPSAAYGALVGAAFHDAVAQAGGTIVDYETYNGEADAVSHAKAIAAEHAGIDALFLPASGTTLKAVVAQLTAGGMDARTHLLGTGLWDVRDIGSDDAALDGAWYAAPDPAARRTFTANYAAAYGHEPPRLATLAYDATALAAVLAKRGSRYDEASLINPNGFAGLDGIFRLTASGAVDRGLAVDEVTPDGARVIDPAPVSFVGGAR